MAIMPMINQSLKKLIQNFMFQLLLYQLKVIKKLLQQLKTGFKRTINWNIKFEDNEHQRSYKLYFLPTVEIKDYNVMND